VKRSKRNETATQDLELTDNIERENVKQHTALPASTGNGISMNRRKVRKQRQSTQHGTPASHIPDQPNDVANHSPSTNSGGMVAPAAVNMCSNPSGQYISDVASNTSRIYGQRIDPVHDFRRYIQPTINRAGTHHDASDTKTAVSTQLHTNSSVTQSASSPSDDEFDDDIAEDILAALTPHDFYTAPASTSTNTIFVNKANTASCVEESLFDLEPNSSSPLLTNSESTSNKHSKKFVSPVTSHTRFKAASAFLSSQEPRKPIVRPSFPTPVRDRSPIVGLSQHTLLRTCFRIGEAINQAVHASKTNNRILIELYARIYESNRIDKKQHFTFCDLFHEKPPYIKATYDSVIWKSVQLFEYDSRRLLQQGKLCRCMGTMKRDGKEWTMTVLNIWEATWEDVEWVEGIVCS
jgi:hypothetical protein